MKYEKILKREDGKLVRIRVQPALCGDGISYIGSLQFGEEGSYTWSAYYDLEKCKYIGSLVTKQEIHQAKLELWEKLKPVEE